MFLLGSEINSNGASFSSVMCISVGTTSEFKCVHCRHWIDVSSVHCRQEKQLVEAGLVKTDRF